MLLRRHQDGAGGHVEPRWLEEGFGMRKYSKLKKIHVFSSVVDWALGGQDGHKTPQDGHKTPQDAAKTPQVGPKTRPRRHHDGEEGHVEPRWLQGGVGTRK